MTDDEKAQAIAELLDIDYEQIELEYKKVQDKVVKYFIIDGRGAELKLDGDLLLQLECGIEFYDCKFPEFIKIEVKTYEYHLGFDKCTFEKGVSFEKSIFESKVVFTDSIFGTNCKEEMQSIKASFKRCVFKKEVKFDKVIAHIPVYFNHAEFGHDGKDGKIETDLVENADFHESRFEDVACFYCAKFFEAPNFSQTIFNGSPNFVSSKINFTFDGLKDFIKRKAGKDEKEQTKGEGSESEGEEGPSSLLQRWQLWFCCKIFDGDEDSTQSKEKEKINWKEKTANDYRDSFRLVKNALIKENDILNASQYHKMELYCKEIELRARIKEAICPQKIKENGEKKTLGSTKQSLLPLAMDFLQLWFYRNTSDHHTDLLRIVGWVMACIGLFGYVLLGIFALDEKIAEIAEFFAKLNCAFIALVYCIFLHLSCYLFCGECWRKIVICLCWILFVSFGVLILSLHPNYIINLLKGSLIDECLFFTWWQNIILLVHVILLGLLLFSLQKTARKNSIIPS